MVDAAAWPLDVGLGAWPSVGLAPLVTPSEVAKDLALPQPQGAAKDKVLKVHSYGTLLK